jgi:hypothetical protein
MTAGTPPKPPAGKPAPKAAPVAPKPAESLSREEIRGIAQAIARAESGNLRDDLVARLMRIEERIGALEKRPITPPAPAVAPTPAPAPTPPPLPVAVAAVPPPLPLPVAVPVVVTPPPLPAVAPVVSLPPAPLIDVPITVDDTDLPFVSGARRRRRLAIILVVFLLATVGTIVVTAMISQAMNNHS